MDEILEPYAVMRVSRLVGKADEYDGWRVHPQAPAIGDL